ncbi:MAG: hypothetical protein EBS25_06545, partial [Actinobacteria bacterium]|nr:hypothetical protein [Actinomycetota bacterium]
RPNAQSRVDRGGKEKTQRGRQLSAVQDDWGWKREGSEARGANQQPGKRNWRPLRDSRSLLARQATETEGIDFEWPRNEEAAEGNCGNSKTWYSYQDAERRPRH